MIDKVKKHAAELQQEIVALEERLKPLTEVNDVAGSEMICRIQKVRASLNRGLDKLLSTGVTKRSPEPKGAIP